MPQHPWSILFSGAVCAALIAGASSPSWAAEDGDGHGSAVVGSFGVGDGLEAAIDERDGSVRFTVPVAGLTVSWDSKAAGGGDRSGLGPAWGLGTMFVTTEGGVQVQTPTGAMFAPDPTHPSGLAAYGTEDLVFEQCGGVLPGRDIDPGAGLPEQDASVRYRFALHELGGTATYFSEAGDPVARITALGEVTTWVWDDLVPHRLLGVVNPDGVVTSLDWATEPGAVLLRQAANLPGEADPVSGEVAPVPVWRLVLDGGRVVSVVDPAGGRVEVGYADDSELVSSLSAVSGGATEVAWRAYDDGTMRAARVRTVDGTGHELSERKWAPAGDGRPSSGWPEYGGEEDLFWSGDSSVRYRTELSDGATRVVSEYNSQHLMLSRRMIVTTGSGERDLQALAVTYPGTEGAAVPDPEALPGNWSRPAETVTTYRDARGGERSVSESTEYDLLGREVSRISSDGTVTTTEYDPVVPEGALLPGGLVIATTVTAPDGLVEATRHTVNGAHTGVVATETLRGRVDEQLVRTGYTEFDLADGGVMVAERVFPGGDQSAEPAATTWDRRVDLGAGTVTSVETVGAGTPAEATTVEVTSLRHGGALAVTDSMGNTSQSGYDALGRPVTALDPAGRPAESVYETAQQHGRNATTVTGPDGVAVTEERDALGRTTRKLDNIHGGEVEPGHVRTVEATEYPRPGTVAVTDAWGATTTTTQDVLGRATETVTPTGLVQVTVYDDVANTATTGLTATGNLADAERVTVETRDDAGRPVSKGGRRADEVPTPEVSTGYDGLGRAIATSDGLLDTTVELDPLGNPVTTRLSPAGIAEAQAGTAGVVTAERRFDGFGRSVEKTLARDGESRSGGALRLDSLGRTVEAVDQVGRVTAYEYAADGLMTRAVAASGQTTVNTYDPVTRALAETVVTSPVGEAVHTAYARDPVTGLVVGVFDPADRAGTEVRTTYDAHRNPLTVTYPDGKTVSHAYDEHGRRTGTTDVAGNVTTLAHTADGRLTQAIQRDADGEPLAEVSYGYDDHGRVSSLTRGNGVTTVYTFTSDAQVASETTTGGDGAPLSERVYTYDPHGNLTERRDTTHDPGRAPVTTTTAYEYDPHRRLVRSVERAGDGTVTRDVGYELTVSGDIRSETVTTESASAHRSSTVREFEYSPLGELVGQTSTTRTGADPAAEAQVVHQAQAYDAAGNLVAVLDGRTYAYDAANRPVVEASPDGPDVRIGYWADGTRRHRTSTDAETGVTRVAEFYWDGTTLLNDLHGATGRRSDGPGDTDPTEVGTASYLLGADARHSRSTVDGAGRPNTTYSGTDRHGNVTDLTDESGRVLARFTYTDYGVATATPTDPEHPLAESGLARHGFGYAGEYADETGIQHLRTRSYDTASMRFTTMDTAELHNLYAYADLNPITNVDPSGRTPVVDNENWITIGLAIAGLVGTFVAAWFAPPLQAGLVMQTMVLVRTIQVMTGVGAFTDLVSLFGGAARELDLRPEQIPGGDPNFDLDGLMHQFEAGVAFAGWGIAFGVAGTTHKLAHIIKSTLKPARAVALKSPLETDVDEFFAALWAAYRDEQRVDLHGMPAAQKLAADVGYIPIITQLTEANKQFMELASWRAFLSEREVFTQQNLIDFNNHIIEYRNKGVAIAALAKGQGATDAEIATLIAPFQPTVEMAQKYPNLNLALSEALTGARMV